MTDSVDRFSGFAALYDEVRPVPPVAVTELLVQLARISRPAVVVDLGSGTGVSAVIWTGRADRVVAVEPNGEMRTAAAARLWSVGEASGGNGVDSSYGRSDREDPPVVGDREEALTVPTLQAS